MGKSRARKWQNGKKCKGITKSGRPCFGDPQRGTEYCGAHQSQAPKNVTPSKSKWRGDSKKQVPERVKFAARFDGMCVICELPYSVGEQIQRMDSHYVHSSCWQHLRLLELKIEHEDARQMPSGKAPTEDLLGLWDRIMKA